MQLLGLAEGAGLLQHLPDDRPGCQPHAGDAQHAVRLTAGTKLARILAVEEVSVVSRHHQALDRVPAPWRVAAVDEEGLVEAIEREEHPFAVGVQWHPELSEEGSVHDRLFRGLVGAAGMAAAASPVLSRARAEYR
jgi:putative glutamine amidotransferase